MSDRAFEIASSLLPGTPVLECELSTEKHADRIIAQFNLYGEGLRDQIIAHLMEAEDRGFDRYAEATQYSY